MFRDALLRIAGDGGAVSSKRLGQWLSKISGRPVGGFRLNMKRDSSHGNRFALVQLSPAGEAQTPARTRYDGYNEIPF